MEKNTRRSGLSIMKSLIVLIKPLTGIMLLGILLGVLRFLCAIFLTVAGGYCIIYGIYKFIHGGFSVGYDASGILMTALIVFAVAGAVFHYGEQYCNHYNAFRILAIIRHRVFAALRKLCPAKLENKEKGNLITVITCDIELLEVFFAHTVSPIAIAFITSVIMVVFMWYQHPLAAVFSIFAYISVGVILPIWNRRRTADSGRNYRNNMGELDNFIINSTYGIDEILQYNQGSVRLDEMDERLQNLYYTQEDLSVFEGSQKAVTNLVIHFFSWGMFFFMLILYMNKISDFLQLILATLAMISSFGPTAALSSLSNNLSQTLASGERVLSLLEEEPTVEEVSGKEATSFEGADVDNVNFSYGEENILENVSLDIKKGKVLGIHGVSGSGKSTLLKLLMRFWDVNTGEVHISGKNIKNVNTEDLREMTGYVTQETVMFQGTIADNIRVAKQNATLEEIQNAAKKASIHDFISGLPNGYDTTVGELGDSLSDGEKQRIGLARAFLHDGDFLLLDEPTSNLDVLNEGIILKSLSEESAGKTIVLVSHRKSTMSLADKTYEMAKGRFS
ncbi:ABC transporter, ATP-binding protein [Lachnospiraceae bacterium oral taxon 082 str. F0431]|nr:ABC transporter, ATP-binding protein [Lachnospiraceae bacterium oral taxon 082 str. F0431]